ncbi:hypothetical protein [Piscirickettsia litoralis]|uniref:hypothetical protein n=1 Tax=Piscirickettsia litoralis TaxID=1891921 RepID=UPI000A964636|nr:hypothetical protein [Piscirickettsia litoralis]
MRYSVVKCFLFPLKNVIAGISKRGARLAVQQQIKAWQQGKRSTGPKPSAQIVHLVPGDLPAIDTDDSLVIMQELAVQMQSLQGAINKIQQDNEKLQMQLASFETQMGHLATKVDQQNNALLAQNNKLTRKAQKNVPQFSVEDPVVTSSVSSSSTTMASSPVVKPLSLKAQNIASVGAAYAKPANSGSLSAQPLWLQALENITYWGVGLVIVMFLGLFWLGWRLRREHVRRLEDQAVLRATIERMQHPGFRKVANKA